jgi:hypothetical protein
MNTIRTLVVEPSPPTPHRYQIYRQARSGLHYNHGSIIDSPENAVALFLNTSPAFEGGGVRLWDHYEQRHVASAEWFIETTRMGFPVRHRVNVYHDPALAVVAAQIVEQQRLEQEITDRVRMAI